MKTRMRSGVWAIVSLLVISSCVDNTNKANLLDPAIKYQADTMFSHRHKVMSDALDSICFNMQDSLVRVYTDSLVKDQQEQINAILGRKNNK